VIWVTTTPVPFSAENNELVKEYNAAALDVMQQDGQGRVTIVDLYTHVISICGEPPYTACNISNTSPSHPSPHYTAAGYEYLASFVTDAVKSALQSQSQTHGPGHDLDVEARETDTTAIPGNAVQCTGSGPSAAERATSPDFAHFVTGTSSCFQGSSAGCMADGYSDSGYACCELQAGATYCGDSWHCCPKGTKCMADCSLHGCGCTPA